MDCCFYLFFFFSSRRRHTRFDCDWSSDVCSSDLESVSNRVSHSDRDDRYRGRRKLCSTGDRKSVVLGKSVDLGGRRIIKKKKKKRIGALTSNIQRTEKPKDRRLTTEPT